MKLILQHMQPNYKRENHRPSWLMKTHRLHFYVLVHGNAAGELLLIDGKDQNCAVVNRTVPVRPRRTTAVH